MFESVSKAIVRHRRIVQRVFLPCLLVVLLTLVGCSTKHYRKSADEETAKIIAEKTPQVPNMDPNFTIEPTDALSLEGLPTCPQAPDFLGVEGQVEKDAPILSLEKTLEIAVQHSRIYQSRKEQVYLQALSLTLARHQFAPLFSAKSNAEYAVNTAEVQGFEVDPSTGQPRPVTSDQLVERNSIETHGSVNTSWLIRDLGRISTAFTNDFFRYLSGDASTITRSQLGAMFTRPLLRNAGFKTEMENLTLAERETLYSLRDFVRFRKQFSVDIAAVYYRVLQNRDTARNTYLALQSFRKSAARTQALVDEGRVKLAELGRLQQQELSQENSWSAAVRNYKLSLDNLKIQLGLSTDANLVLDEKELQELTIIHPDISVEDATQVALLVSRLDLQNLANEWEDAKRAVALAANGLLPQVDFSANVSISSPDDKRTGFALPELDRYRWGAGLDFDLPLDQKAKRNIYRAALIRQEQAARAFAEVKDTIKLQIREDWRALEQTKRSYENSELGVKLAERRVEEQNLLAEVGRGRAQDQVDAQNDLTAAKNQRTQTLVDHTVARLRFWEHMGILFIKEHGKWQDVSDVKELQKP
jgi:outer membrane protein TolC